MSSLPACSKTVMLRPISPEAAEGEQAQAVRGQGWRGAEIGVRVAHGNALSRA